MNRNAPIVPRLTRQIADHVWDLSELLRMIQIQHDTKNQPYIEWEHQCQADASEHGFSVEMAIEIGRELHREDI